MLRWAPGHIGGGTLWDSIRRRDRTTLRSRLARQPSPDFLVAALTLVRVWLRVLPRRLRPQSALFDTSRFAFAKKSDSNRS
jgi:hypothetical protein